MTEATTPTTPNPPPPNMGDFFKDAAIDDIAHTTIGEITKLLDKMDVPYRVNDDLAIPRLETNYTVDLAWGISRNTLLAQIKYMQALEEWYNALYEPAIHEMQTYLWAYPRPHRFNVLSELDFSHLQQDIRQFKNIGDFILDVYIDTEIYDPDFAVAWCSYLQDYAPCFAYTFKDIDDEKIYTIYHGTEYDRPADKGYADYQANAWTFKFTTAQFFAERFVNNKDGQKSRPILKLKLSGREIKEQALFYTNKRGEEEIYFPISDEMITAADIIL